jgi:hypothetical protein
MKIRSWFLAPAIAGALAVGCGVAQAQNCAGQPAANTVCAGPTSGSSGFPSFRALVGADIPSGTLAPGLMVIGHITGVNFNSANTDNAITIKLPTGYTRYTNVGAWITNASASLTTSTVGLFSATGGGGTALFTAQAVTVSTSTDAATNNAQQIQPANGGTASYTIGGFPTLQFRVQNAQGSAATGDVTIYGRAVP